MNSTHFTKNYIISKHTLMLESKQVGKKIHTVVHDQRGKFEVCVKPMQIIKNSCKAMGSSYEGSTAQSRKLLGKWQKQKLPIVVANDFGVPLVMFPLFSPKAKYNTWVMYNHITGYDQSETNSSVTLSRKHSFQLPISKASLAFQSASSGVIQKNVQERWQNNEMFF